MENVIVSVSNIAALYPLGMAADKSLLDPFLVLFAALGSFVYHIFESHKHDMNGFGSSESVSKALLNVDRFFAVLLVTRVLYTRWKRVVHLHRAVLLSLLFLFISEFPYFESKLLYVVTHCAWHVLAFVTCGRAFKDDKRAQTRS